MIFAGKLIVCLVWVFWMMVVDNYAMGKEKSTHPMMDHSSMTLTEIEKVKQRLMNKENQPAPEYNPTYGTTFDRVIERGFIICGTNDEFPGFSEEVYDSETGVVWKGFDVDVCKAVAAAVFGDTTAIQYEIVDGVSRFTH